MAESDRRTPDRPLPTSFPERSAEKYEDFYRKFMKWANQNNVKEFTEPVILEYFKESATLYKPSTLWAHYSMLKSTLEAYHSVEIRKFCKITRFIKEQSVGYQATTSKMLTSAEVNKFIREAPDHIHLMHKVVIILALAGGCRCSELHDMTLDDIEDCKSILMVRIPGKIQGVAVQRTFGVSNPKNSEVDLLDYYRRYVALRPRKTLHRQLFVNYKQGKCTVQVVGINMFGKIPSTIATYLKLPNPNRYTGHCLRKTAGSNINRNESEFGVRLRPELYQLDKSAFNIGKFISPIPEDSPEVCAPNPIEIKTEIEQVFVPNDHETEYSTNSDFSLTNQTELSDRKLELEDHPEYVEIDSRKFSSKETQTDNDNSKLDETSLFFISIGQVVNKLPELLRSKIRMEVASLVGETEIAYLSKIGEVEKSSDEVDSKKRRADSDEVDTFFSSVTKSVKKLKTLSRAKVRLKVSTIVGEAEIEQLEDKEKSSEK